MVAQKRASEISVLSELKLTFDDPVDMMVHYPFAQIEEDHTQVNELVILLKPWDPVRVVGYTNHPNLRSWASTTATVISSELSPVTKLTPGADATVFTLPYSRYAMWFRLDVKSHTNYHVELHKPGAEAVEESLLWEIALIKDGLTFKAFECSAAQWSSQSNGRGLCTLDHTSLHTGEIAVRATPYAGGWREKYQLKEVDKPDPKDEYSIKVTESKITVQEAWKLDGVGGSS